MQQLTNNRYQNHMDEENVNVTENITVVEQAPVSTAQSLAVPIAIVIAGLAIAAAIFFGGKGQTNQDTPGVAGSKQIGSLSVDPITSADHIFGNPNAKVVIVEYSDTECPFCINFHPTLQRIMSEYGNDGKVAWVYRHFPLPFHTKAPNEAQATECANKLGGNNKFWEYLTKVFATTPGNNNLDPAELPKIAKSIGLDVNAFNKCLASGEMKKIVDNDAQSGVRAGLRGTPYSVILVNKKPVDTIDGAQQYDTVKAQIEKALK